MRIIVLFGFVLLLLGYSLNAQKVIATSAPVNDFVIDGENIIVSTTDGTIEVYNIAGKNMLYKVQFEKTKDFAGNLFDTEVFKIVKIGNVIIAVARGENGFNNIYKISNKKINLLISGNEIKSVVVDIAVSEDNMLLLGLLSNELVKYDIVERKIVYRKQISNYAFSAMCTDENKAFVFATDESGIVHKVKVSTGELLENYKGQNVDNVLCIDYSKGIVVCGGKDRRISTYNIYMNTGSHFDTGKFITTLAISPSGKKIVWYDTETDDLELISLSNNKDIVRLHGHISMVNKIKFISETKIVSAGIDNKVLFWTLK